MLSPNGCVRRGGEAGRGIDELESTSACSTTDGCDCRRSRARLRICWRVSDNCLTVPMTSSRRLLLFGAAFCTALSNNVTVFGFVSTPGCFELLVPRSSAFINSIRMRVMTVSSSSLFFFAHIRYHMSSRVNGSRGDNFRIRPGSIPRGLPLFLRGRRQSRRVGSGSNE